MKPRKIFTFALATVGYVWLQSDQKVEANSTQCYMGCEDQRASDEHYADDQLFSCTEHADLLKQACLFDVNDAYSFCMGQLDNTGCDTAKAYGLQQCDSEDTQRRNDCTELHELAYNRAEDTWQVCLNDCTICDSDPCDWHCPDQPQCCVSGGCS
jgi:hypothetical protein